MKRLWLVGDGKAGHANQLAAVAKRMRDWSATALDVTPALPWRWLSPWAITVGGLRQLGPLPEATPDLILACGRQAVAPALALKRRFRVPAAALQDPGPAARRRFDLIAAPAHDAVPEPLDESSWRLVITKGAPSRVTTAWLEAARAAWQEVLAPLPGPRVAVLLGGPNRAFRMDGPVIERVGQQITSLWEQAGSLLVTTSRRTPEALVAALRKLMEDRPGILFDGNGPNPYAGFLAHADVILVSEDSIAMASDAASTGKPMARLALAGGSLKFRTFGAMLEADGKGDVFDGGIPTRSAPPWDDAAVVAEALIDLVGAPSAQT